ncbi:MAG TPA: FMN-binding negative transcriptional regulator [Planctomycetota bacterium]|nr:FMN-binding negative transcriptional regulator [Planctomycetota bacterium]
MYLPSHFAVSDPARMTALMRAHPFAVVVADPGGGDQAAHVPLLVDRQPTADGGRIVLHGHVARANPIWRASRALAVFRGPHAYISAAWYGEPDTVPTWNYQAVHVAGPLTVIDDAQAERAWFERLGAEHDPLAAQWWAGLSAAVFDRLRQATVWFRIDGERVDGKSKLSQNHSPGRRARVVSALRAAGGEDRLAIAQAMEDG